jgi:hypothetical protein
LDNKTNRKGAVIMTKYRIEERIKAAQAVMAGESIAGRGGRHHLQKNPSFSRLTLKKERDSELGEGRVSPD